VCDPCGGPSKASLYAVKQRGKTIVAMRAEDQVCLNHPVQIILVQINLI
jgi:hypothetical protein